MYLSRDMTKPTKWLCAQRRLRSAWVSAQSDQSLRCPHEETLGPYLLIERPAKTLFRLDGCPGWSESSLGAHSFCWYCHVAAHVFSEVSCPSSVSNGQLAAQCSIGVNATCDNITCDQGYTMNGDIISLVCTETGTWDLNISFQCNATMTSGWLSNFVLICAIVSESFEPCHEITVLFVLRKFILQTRMRSHPMGLDVWFCSDPSSTSILYVFEQQRLWWDCEDAQARLSPRWSPKW